MKSEQNGLDSGFGFDFAYCPGCGQKMPEGAVTNPLHCDRCGFTLYCNVAAAVCALITKGQKLLATVRRHPPAAGMLDLPGGFVDPDESAEEALARELQEELGVSMTGCRYFAACPNIYPCRGITYRTLDLAFVCQISATDTIRCADDVADIRWIEPAGVDYSLFGLESTRWFVKRFAVGATGGRP